jgi:hypothetical protein
MDWPGVKLRPLCLCHGKAPWSVPSVSLVSTITCVCVAVAFSLEHASDYVLMYGGLYYIGPMFDILFVVVDMTFAV